MATARSTQGYTVRLDDETALGTAGGNVDKEVRLAAAPTIPTATRQLQEQPNIGAENANDASDKPIPFEPGQMDALTLPIHIRRGATTNTPPLYYFGLSGGFAGDIGADTDVDDGTPAADEFITTGNVFGDTADHYGKAVLVQLANDTTYYPCLLADYDHGSLTAKPMMDCPTIPGDNNLIKRMFNLWTDPSAIAAADTLQFVANTRGDYSDGTGAEYLSYTLAGCSMSNGFGDITINKEGAVVLSPNFHVADTAITDELLDAATFLEGNTSGATTSSFQTNEGSNFRCEFAAYAAGGGITAATVNMLSATIRTGVSTIPVDGIGGTNKNGWQSYMARVVPPECDLQILLDSNYMNDSSAGYEAITGNQDMYLGLVWTTESLDVPASGIWMPRCYQYAPPDVEMFGENYQIMTLHLRGTAPAYTGSPTTNGSSGMSPIVIAVHGQAS